MPPVFKKTGGFLTEKLLHWISADMSHISISGSLITNTGYHNKLHTSKNKLPLFILTHKKAQPNWLGEHLTASIIAH